MYKLKLVDSLGRECLETCGVTKKTWNEINNLSFTYITSRDLRKKLLNIFCDNGFIKRMYIHPEHRIFITAEKSKIGISILFAHYAQFYFELAKLVYLKNTKKINKATIILPSIKLQDALMKKGNLATHEKISKQMSLFTNQYDIELNILYLDIKKIEK